METSTNPRHARCNRPAHARSLPLFAPLTARRAAVALAALALTAPARAVPADEPEGPWTPSPWDVEHLDLDVALDPATGAVEGTAALTVSPRGGPARSIRLHQRGLDIHAVAIDGAPATFETAPDVLRIHWPDATPDARRHVVTVTWSAAPETGMHARAATRSRPVQAWTQGENTDHRYWFPAWDEPSDMATLSVAVTVPNGITAVANGDLVGQELTDDGRTRWRYQLDQPIVNYLVAVVAGDLARWPVAAQRADGRALPMEVLAPRDVPEAVALRDAAVAADMLPWLERLTGVPYPYTVYRQAWVRRFMYGGMENATLTTLSEERLRDDGEVDLGGGESLVAHELAHQVFGDLVTCRGWRELWLNEGFATFVAARWMREAAGDDAWAEKVDGWHAASRDTTHPVAWRPSAGPDHPPNHAVYVRGASALQALSVALGPSVLDAGVAAYLQRHSFSLVETDDLRRALEDASGQPLTWLFDRLIHGVGAPKITARPTWASGQLTVALDITGDQDWPGPIDIVVQPAEGPPITRRVTRLDRGAKIVLPLEAPPRFVAVDPEGGVLAHLDVHQSTAAWVAMLEQGPTALSRRRAATALGAVRDDKDAAEQALTRALRGAYAHEGAPRPHHALARHAAQRLGALGTPTAHAALVDAVADRALPAEVRLAAAQALRGARLETSATSVLLAALSRDPSPQVRAAALRAFADAVRQPEATAAATLLLSGRDPSRTGAIHAAAAQTLGEAGPGAARRLLRYLGDDRRQVAHAAADALVAAYAEPRRKGEPLPDAPRLALEQLLLSEDLRTRERAVGWLAGWGDPAAIPALKAAAARSHRDAVHDAVARAVGALRARAAARTPDALREALEQLETLAERVETLEDRLAEQETR